MMTTIVQVEFRPSLLSIRDDILQYNRNLALVELEVDDLVRLGFPADQLLLDLSLELASPCRMTCWRVVTTNPISGQKGKGGGKSAPKFLCRGPRARRKQ
jgi:hypothetical protein